MIAQLVFAALSIGAVSNAPSDRQLHPCKYSTEFKRMNFWAGTWVVTSPKGHRLGTSRVDVILDQCALLENWSGARGGAGKSFTFYDPSSKQWYQRWVDSSGSHTDYTGRVDGASLLFMARSVGADGKPVWERMRFTPMSHGRVHQYIDTSPDGKKWTAAFDGIYTASGGSGPS
jgi:hypothetical protein